MNIEINDNRIWEAVKGEVENEIADKIFDLEVQSSDDVAEILNQEFQYCLEDNRYVVEDICDSMIDYRSAEQEDALNALDDRIELVIKNLERKIVQLQTQLKVANFKLRRSK